MRSAFARATANLRPVEERIRVSVSAPAHFRFDPLDKLETRLSSGSGRYGSRSNAARRSTQNGLIYFKNNTTKPRYLQEKNELTLRWMLLSRRAHISGSAWGNSELPGNYRCDTGFGGNCIPTAYRGAILTIARKCGRRTVPELADAWDPESNYAKPAIDRVMGTKTAATLGCVLVAALLIGLATHSRLRKGNESLWFPTGDARRRRAAYPRRRGRRRPVIRYLRRTNVPAIMSCRACFRGVQPASMNPIQKMSTQLPDERRRGSERLQLSCNAGCDMCICP